MTGFINKLKNLFFRRQVQNTRNSQESTSNSASTQSVDSKNVGITEEVVVNLMQQLQHTKEGQFSCEDSYALLDEYVELVISDEDVERLLPLVKAHIDACPDCKLEFEVLRKVLESEE